MKKRKRCLDQIELLMSPIINEEVTSTTPKKRNRQPRPDYTQMSWWRLIRHPDIRDVNSRQHKYFRRRFRLPYALFEIIINMCYERNWFPVHTRGEDGAMPKKNAAPLELKVLGVLRLLGRGGPFDDLFDGSGIHENTHRTFFEQFCNKFVSELYTEFIHVPENEELNEVTEIYRKLGFPGCVGSVDVVHVWWDMVPYEMKACCTGKEKIPTLAFEVVCDHHKKIRAVTPSHVGSMNDKSIVRFDAFVMAVKNKKLYDDLEFTLQKRNQLTNEVEDVKVRGGYMISDGGYHKWRCLQCPLKHPATEPELLYSKRLESVRKDIEGCYGILKKRFQILKCPIQFHNQITIDMVFFTCCILHNMLLTFDGLDLRWLDEENEEEPNDGFDEEYDAVELDVGRRQAFLDSLAPNENDVLLADVHDEVEIEYEQDHFQLRTMLITHYKIAHDLQTAHWLT
jgi:hypothetical protein